MKTLFYLGVTGAGLLASCSPYQFDFKKEASAYKPDNTPNGPWKGTWKSETNGHHGPIWCLVSPTEKRNNHWDFRYRAGWGSFQFGDYTHTLPAIQAEDGSLPIKGSMTLPKGFGTYAIEGKVTPTTFTARFEGENDKGTMKLSRPVKMPK